MGLLKIDVKTTEETQSAEVDYTVSDMSPEVIAKAISSVLIDIADCSYGNDEERMLVKRFMISDITSRIVENLSS